MLVRALPRSVLVAVLLTLSFPARAEENAAVAVARAPAPTLLEEASPQELGVINSGMSPWVPSLAITLVAVPSHAPSVGDFSERFGFEQGQFELIELEWKGFSLLASPVEEAALGSALYGQLELEPSIKGTFRLLPCLFVSLEYAATLGPLAIPAALTEQAHRVFCVLDFAWRGGALNFVIGYGLSGPEKWVASLGLEFDLEPPPAS